MSLDPSSWRLWGLTADWHLQHQLNTAPLDLTKIFVCPDLLSGSHPKLTSFAHIGIFCTRITHLMPISPHETAPRQLPTTPNIISSERASHCIAQRGSNAQRHTLESCLYAEVGKRSEQTGCTRQQFPSARPKLTHQASYQKNKYQHMLLAQIGLLLSTK